MALFDARIKFEEELHYANSNTKSQIGQQTTGKFPLKIQ